jgi:hypothetical protein
MFDGDWRISRPLVLTGSAPTAKERGACLIDRSSRSNGLLRRRPDYRFCGGTRRELRISGICYSPEYVVHSDGYASTPIPTPSATDL